MNITTKLEGTTLTVTLDGRLDTTTAPKLEAALGSSLDGVTGLVLDLAGLEYLSSAGLRVILSAHRQMGGSIVIRNVNETIMEVFEVTGFTDILTIE